MIFTSIAVGFVVFLVFKFLFKVEMLYSILFGIFGLVAASALFVLL